MLCLDSIGWDSYGRVQSICNFWQRLRPYFSSQLCISSCMDTKIYSSTSSSGFMYCTNNSFPYISHPCFYAAFSLTFAVFSCFSPGQWEGPLQGHSRRSSGSFPQCQGAHCSSGFTTSPSHQSSQQLSGCSAYGCQHSDWHHLWAYYGSGQAKAVHTTSSWHLPFSTFR